MTIQEIARMAGVSSAAVSRYMNQGSLSQEKRERIRAVIEQTDYRPSEYARALRTKRSRQIGVVVPQIDSEAVPRILSGISQELDQENYHFLLMNSSGSMEKEVRMLASFAGSQVDGLILAASQITGGHREEIEKMPFPVVLVGQRTDICSCVYHNDRQAAWAAMNHLLKSGVERPAYLGVTRRDLAAGEARFQGAGAALAQNGFSIEEIPKEEVEFTSESGYRGMEKLLEARETPDGVFCASDLIAAGAMACLRDRGYRVPHQVRVTGIGHGRVADLLTPRLTTVHYHYKTRGREAARMLLELIENPRARRREKQLQVRLVVQESA